jgi:tetratricopeptide (TPR) repeat protein
MRRFHHQPGPRSRPRPTAGARYLGPLRTGGPLAFVALLLTGAALHVFPSALLGQSNPADSARRLARAGHIAEALAYGESAARRSPSDPLAQLALATGAMAAERYDRAIEAADSALALAPDLGAVQRVFGQAYLSHAREHSSLGAIRRVKAGREALERAIALDPGDLDARRTLMQFLLQAPAIVGGNREQAARQADEINRRDTVLGLVARIEVDDGERRKQEVATSFERALALVGSPADSTGELGPELLRVVRRLHDRRQPGELGERIEERLRRR